MAVGQESAEYAVDIDRDIVAASLRAWLNRQRFHALTSVEVTELLTLTIRHWAHEQGWQSRTEAPTGVDSADGRPGLYDIQCRRRNGPLITIEIDRSNKQWSLRKLVHAAEQGHVAVWIRWSAAPVPLEIPVGVRLIRAATTRRKDPDRSWLHSLQADSCG